MSLWAGLWSGLWASLSGGEIVRTPYLVTDAGGDTYQTFGGADDYEVRE